MGFAEKVRRCLAEKGWKQDDLAADIGTRQQVVSRWISDDKIPKVKYLSRIARSLGCTIEYLVDDAVTDPQGLPAEERELLRYYRWLKSKPSERMDLDEAKYRLSRSSSSPGGPTIRAGPPPGESVPELETEDQRRRGEVKRRDEGDGGREKGGEAI